MGFSIIYSIKDEKGAVATTEVNLPSAVSFHDVAIFAGQMALVIDRLITGVITRVGICFTLDMSQLGIGSIINPSSDVEEGARFQFKTGTGFYTSNRIPTFDETKIVQGTREVDVTDADVAAFIFAMENGINTSTASFNGVSGTGFIEPSDTRGDDIDSTESAVEQFLSSRGR